MHQVLDAELTGHSQMSPDHSLSFLAEAALTLGGYTLTRRDVIPAATRMLRDFLGGGYVVFSSYENDRNALRVRCVAGIGDRFSGLWRDFLDRVPGGLLPIPEGFPWRAVTVPVLMPMAGGLTELTFGALDPETARMVEATLGIHRCWLLGLGRGSRFLGTLAILTGPDQPLLDYRVIETFGTLLTMTLMARDSQGHRVPGLGEREGDASRGGQVPRGSEEPERMAWRVLEDQVELICRYGVDGRLRFVNPSFCQVFGRSAEELLGQSSMHLVHPRDRRRRRRHLSRLSPMSPVGEIEHRVIRGDGTVAWIQWNDRAVFDAEGRPVEYQSVGRDITRKRQAEERMAWLATHDALTGLPNRVLLRDRLYTIIHRSGRTGRPFALALADLDGFKEINDRFGHAAGDAFLRELSRVLSGAFRRSDTVARLGGDEFVVLIGDCGGPESRHVWIDKLRRCLATPLTVGSCPTSIALSGSVGVVVACGPEADPDRLLVQADQAMYAAKRAGKGCVVFFDELPPGEGSAEEEG